MDVVEVVGEEILASEDTPKEGKRGSGKRELEPSTEIPSPAGSSSSKKLKTGQEGVREPKTSRKGGKDLMTAFKKNLSSSSDQEIVTMIKDVNKIIGETIQQRILASKAKEKTTEILQEFEDYKYNQAKLTLMNERLYTDYCALYDGLFLSVFHSCQPSTPEQLNKFLQTTQNKLEGALAPFFFFLIFKK